MFILSTPLTVTSRQDGSERIACDIRSKRVAARGKLEYKAQSCELGGAAFCDRLIGRSGCVTNTKNELPRPRICSEFAGGLQREITVRQGRREVLRRAVDDVDAVPDKEV